MHEQSATRALLVGEQRGCLPNLRQALDGLGIETQWVSSPFEITAQLRQPSPPQVIFTATELAVGGWVDVIEAARRFGNKTPVIVVSRFVDFTLYLDALEGGASDFIVPPFEARDLAYVVQSALLKSRGPAAAMCAAVA
jgi:DNA-binding NtrC family response regulator